MNTQTAKVRRCPACRNAELAPAEYVREFNPNKKSVAVTLLTSRCPLCGTVATSATQHAENLSRLKARKAEYNGLLLGEEILALRRRYGITQQAAAKIFGKGKIAFSRYENETSYPDLSTTSLLELAIQMPGVIRLLADKAGVELPLWAARCEDERGAKVRGITDVRVADLSAQRWAKRELSEIRRASVGLRFPFRPETSSTEFMKTSVNDDQFHSVGAAFG